MHDEYEKRERLKRVSRRLGPEAVLTDMLETFPYEYPHSPISIRTQTDEFSSVCPMTGLPDFGTLEISYSPDQKVLELKSLKYYLFQFRDVGIFYEHLVNRILADLIAALAPQQISVIGRFTPRGGLQTTIEAHWPHV